MASSGSRELTDDEVESLLFDEETLAELGYARQATADWMTATWVSYQADEELDEAQIKWVDGILKIESHRESQMEPYNKNKLWRICRN